MVFKYIESVSCKRSVNPSGIFTNLKFGSMVIWTLYQIHKIPISHMNFLQGLSTLHIECLVHISDNLEFFLHSCFWFPLKVGGIPMLSLARCFMGWMLSTRLKLKERVVYKIYYVNSLLIVKMMLNAHSFWVQCKKYRHTLPITVIF